MGMRSYMYNLLRTTMVAQMDFTLFRYRITGGDYLHIANCIRNGHLQIILSAAPRYLERAEYHVRYNCFIFGLNIGSSVRSDSMIIHEATHAINDWHGRVAPGLLDETLAYVAQKLYECRVDSAVFEATRDLIRDGTAEWRCDSDTGECTLHLTSLSLYDYASIIAVTMIEGGTPTTDMVWGLKQAILRHPEYQEPAIRNVGYDRITRVVIPEAYLREVIGVIATD